MKPVKLTMSAFGPYADVETLDFRVLGDHTLFLICGPTGAGKSTILDAMCYALYGKTSGDLRKPVSMRSSYVGYDRETYVEFDFRLGNTYYRVRRSPTQEVLGKSGKKVVTHQAKAELSEIDEEGNVTKQIAVKGVEKAVEDLMGVGVEQFRQIILLPQGEFRKLLLADSTDRQAIMQELFGTGRYLALENRLGDKARELAGDVIDGKRQIEVLLGTAGLSEEELPSAIENFRKNLETLSGKLKGLQEKQRHFQKEKKIVVELDAAFNALQAAEKKKEELLAETEDMKSLSVKLRKTREAEKLQIVRENVESDYLDFHHKEKAVKKTESDLLEAKKKQPEVKRRMEEIQKEAPLQEKRIGRLAELSLYEGVKERYGKALSAAKDAESRVKAGEKKLEEHRKNLALAEEVTKKKTFAYESISEAFIHGQSALLASTLSEGKPCPVCGSLSHPSPARAEGRLYEKKAVDDAREEKETAEKEEKKLRSGKEEFEGKVLGPARAALQSARTALSELETQLPEKYRRGDVLKDEIDSLTRGKDAYIKNKADAEAEYNSLGNLLASLETGLKNATAACKAAGEKYKTGISDFERKVLAAGFADTKEQKKYQDYRNDIAVMEKELQDYETDRKSTEDTILKNKEITEGKIRPDMRKWEEEETALNEEIASLSAESGREKTRLSQLENIEKTIKTEKEKIQGKDHRYQIVGGLYDAVRGKENGINLERFVLGALLDDVTRKANLRLFTMSSGRYQLERKTGERADNRKKAGLDLEVMDSYTGKARDASTLSGGETFLASLSLALGLADVVQEYAGGVRLDSMFIDEGFGSLDAETLDLALKALVSLKSQNRLVGIISHVGELEERITTRLRITRTREGSHAAFEVE